MAVWLQAFDEVMVQSVQQLHTHLHLYLHTQLHTSCAVRAGLDELSSTLGVRAGVWNCGNLRNIMEDFAEWKVEAGS